MLSLPAPFTLPLHPDLPLSGIDIRKCRVMSSKKMPLMLTFTINQHQQINNIIGGDRYFFITVIIIFIAPSPNQQSRC